MKYFFHVLIFSVLVTVCTQGAFAQNTQLPSNNGGTQLPANNGGTQLPVNEGNSLSLKNPIQAKSVGALFEAILDIILVFAIPIIVFFIILAGFRYVTARGNGHVIEEAHMALLYALIGGVLILGARVLIEVISGTVDAIKG